MTRFNTTIALAAVAALAVLGGCEKSSVTGEHGEKLTLVKPADQSIKQGDSNKLGIAITRKNFDDAVEIEITNLPSGVTVANGARQTIPSGGMKLDSVTLVAAPDAALVKDHRVAVTARGPGGIAVTEHFELDVEAK